MQYIDEVLAVIGDVWSRRDAIKEGLKSRVELVRASTILNAGLFAELLAEIESELDR